VTAARTKRKPVSKREQARRARQRAETRRVGNRAAKSRQRSRDSFSAYGKALLGTDDPEVARITFAANPALVAHLLAEHDLIPEKLRGLRDAVYVHDGYDSDHIEFCDSAVSVESWYKEDHRRDDIDDALVNGWCAMQQVAAEGLRQSRLDHHVRDMVDTATGGGLTKTSEQWLADLIDYLGVS
jgi:hypothetical protein